MTPNDMTRELSSTRELLSVRPVLVNMVLAVRHNWGNESRQYNDQRGFFANSLWARLESEKIRSQGTAFRIEEIPAVRLDSADGSTVLVSFNQSNPFQEDEDARSRADLKVGLATGDAIRMLTSVDNNSAAERHGVVALNVLRGADLPMAGGTCRTWESWPSEPHFGVDGERAGVRDGRGS